MNACEIPPSDIDGVRQLDCLQHIDLFPPAKRRARLKRLITAIHAAPSHPAGGSPDAKAPVATRPVRTTARAEAAGEPARDADEERQAYLAALKKETGQIAIRGLQVGLASGGDPASLMSTLTILHLSDLQFGKNHPYPKGDDSFHICTPSWPRIWSGWRPKWTCGRRCWWSRATSSLPAEYAAAHKFLDKLANHLSIPRARAIVLPGNHDINRNLYQGARLMADGSGEPFDEPFFPKFGNFQRFFHHDLTVAARLPWT